MILPLTQLPARSLREPAKKVAQVDKSIKKLIQDMTETLDFVSGVGLAAPQVEVSQRLFIIKYPKVPKVFINPELKLLDKTLTSEIEGCLSVPGRRGPTPRAKSVSVKYLDEYGRPQIYEATGFRAKIIQHEIDHLKGKLYVDRIKNPNDFHQIPSARVVFFGTPNFGALVLWHLLGHSWATNDQVLAVVTSPDKPVGRSKTLAASPVKELAEKFSIPVLTPEKLRGNSEIVSSIKKLNPNLLVLAAYGQIVPKELLDIPSQGSLNVHPSLLPKYRGASPIQTAFLNQEKETGVTIIKMSEKVDSGEILAQIKVPIHSLDNYQTLSIKLANLGGNLIRQLLSMWMEGEIKAHPQDETLASITPMIKKEDGFIDWKKPPKNLEAMIRAYYPWPGVWTEFKGKILKFLPGGLVQLEGKSPVKLEVFRQGHPQLPKLV